MKIDYRYKDVEPCLGSVVRPWLGCFYPECTIGSSRGVHYGIGCCCEIVEFRVKVRNL